MVARSEECSRSTVIIIIITTTTTTTTPTTIIMIIMIITHYQCCERVSSIKVCMIQLYTRTPHTGGLFCVAQRLPHTTK